MDANRQKANRCGARGPWDGATSWSAIAVLVVLVVLVVIGLLSGRVAWSSMRGLNGQTDLSSSKATLERSVWFCQAMPTKTADRAAGASRASARERLLTAASELFYEE